jgi:N-acetylmuramoyl-L-alanine amidase
MIRPLYAFSGLGLLALLASCAGPAASCAGRDYWGHRSGPQGFDTVIIDAGHGGKDSGATSKTTGQQEKSLTLDMAQRIGAQLNGSFHTILMRSDDTFVDLDERVARANHYGNAILVSIHFNSGPKHLRGPETYYWRVDSHGLAVRLQRAMAQASPGEHSNRGLVRRRLRLTRNPQIPCVLMEGGYLSHPAEARLVCTPVYRQRLAVAIAAAIRTQAASGDAGTGPLPPPLTSPASRPNDARE